MLLAGREGAGKSHILRCTEAILESGGEGATEGARLLHAADTTDPGVCCREPLAAWIPVLHACLMGDNGGDDADTSANQSMSIAEACRAWTSKHSEHAAQLQTLIDVVCGRVLEPEDPVSRRVQTPEERFALVHLVAEVVSTTATEGDQNLCVVLDDASAMDSLSWAVVLVLADRLAATPTDRATFSTMPLLLVLAVRENPLDGTLLCPPSEDIGGWPIVVVPPLTVEETGELLLSVVSDGADTVDPAVNAVVNQECLGLPRYILEWISIQQRIGGTSTDQTDLQLKWAAKGPDGNPRRLVADLPPSLEWELGRSFDGQRQQEEWQLTLQLIAVISTAVAGVATDPKGVSGVCGDILIQTHPRRLSEPVLSQYLVEMERLGFLIRAESSRDAAGSNPELGSGEDSRVLLAKSLAAGQLATETWMWRSEEARQAVYHTLTTRERRDMHEALAEHLEARVLDGMDLVSMPLEEWKLAEEERRACFVQLIEHAALSMDQPKVLRLLEKLPGGPGMMLTDDERKALRQELWLLKPPALRKRAMVEEIRGDLITLAEKSEGSWDDLESSKISRLVELIVSHQVFTRARDERRANEERDALRAATAEARRLHEEGVKTGARPAAMERLRQAVSKAEVAMWTEHVAGDPDATNPMALAVRYFPLDQVLAALKERHDDDLAPETALMNATHWAVAAWKLAGHHGERTKRSHALVLKENAEAGEHMYGNAIDVRASGRFDRTVLSFLEPPRDSNLAIEGGPLLLPGAVPTVADREAEQAKALVLGSRQVRALTDAAAVALRFGAYSSYPNAQSMAMEQEALLARKSQLAEEVAALEEQLRARDDPIIELIKPEDPPPEPEPEPEPELEDADKPVAAVEKGCCWFCFCIPRKKEKKKSKLAGPAVSYVDDY